MLTKSFPHALTTIHIISQRKAALTQQQQGSSVVLIGVYDGWAWPATTETNSKHKWSKEETSDIFLRFIMASKSTQTKQDHGVVVFAPTAVLLMFADYVIYGNSPWLTAPPHPPITVIGSHTDVASRYVTLRHGMNELFFCDHTDKWGISRE